MAHEPAMTIAVTGVRVRPLTLATGRGRAPSDAIPYMRREDAVRHSNVVFVVAISATDASTVSPVSPSRCSRTDATGRGEDARAPAPMTLTETTATRT